MPNLSPDLPPGSISLPLDFALNRSLSPGALHTWVLLRLLALDGLETPALSLLQISEYTGKHPSTIYVHLAVLKRLGAVSWRSVDFGVIVISFSADPAGASPVPKFEPPSRPNRRSRNSKNLEFDSGYSESDSENLEFDSGNSETNSENLEFDSGNPEYDSENLEFDSKYPESLQGFTPDSRNPELDSENSEPPSLKDSLNNNNNNEEELKREGMLQKSGKSDKPGSRDDPSQIYTDITGIHATKVQRLQLTDSITDLALWQSTLEHWMLHHWNPRNIPGMLELYDRGGPSVCRFCQKPASSAPKPKPTILEQNLSLLDEYLQEPPDG